MGANAQTSVPTFTAGEVLTAANMNLSARTGVPVFADTTARDAGFGGTGEKTLAEGQLCYLESTDVVQYYNGSTWLTASGGLVRITGGDFSAVATLNIDNVFTSAFRNYRLIFQYQTSTTSGPVAQFRVGGVAAATNYNYQDMYGVSSSAGAGRYTSQTSFVVGALTNGAFISCVDMLLVGPQLAQATVGVSLTNSTNATYAAPQVVAYAWNHSTATAYDGIGISVASGNMTGNYQIYGLVN